MTRCTNLFLAQDAKTPVQITGDNVLITTSSGGTFAIAKQENQLPDNLAAIANSGDFAVVTFGDQSMLNVGTSFHWPYSTMWVVYLDSNFTQFSVISW